MVRIEDLKCDGLMLYQDDNLYTFTSDAVILSNYVTIQKGEKALEVGSGSGVISILVAYKNNANNISAFEVQKKMYDLSLKNLKLNHMEDRITIYNEPIQNWKNIIPANSMDIIFTNPPYKKIGNVLNANESRQIARHEIKLNLSELCEAAKGILKYGGRIYIVYDSSRLAELITELRKNGLEPKEMFLTYPDIEKDACLVVVKAVSGGRPGLKVLPPIITNDKDGKYIEQIKNMKIR